MESTQLCRSICKILDGEKMNECVNALIFSMCHVAHKTIRKDLINEFFEKVKNVMEVASNGDLKCPRSFYRIFLRMHQN